MCIGNVWYYKAYKCSEPEKILKIKANITSIENIDGIDYYFFNAPSVDIRYLLRKLDEGVFLKVMRFPFPIFNFSINVVFTPEFPMMKYPLLKGKKWNYEGYAEAKILGVFKITRNVKAEFEVIKRDKIITDAGRLDTYHIRVNVDEGDGKGIKIKKYWYAKNIGFAISDNDNHKCELVGYVVKSDVDKKERKKVPEGESEYK
ncbi:MAG: hypothetical protein N2114_06020 [Candidatus Goldbacteria bacterium]|nr:hypothetical protein [Candidatus Goldiibacteriota bacterium]